MTAPDRWKCPVCDTTTPWREIPDSPCYNNARYRRCNACDTVMLFPLPVAEENLAFEGEALAEEIALNDDCRVPLLRRRVQALGAPPRNGTFLDIGCSAGHGMQLAREAGWEVSGIELSAALAEKSRRRVPGAHIHVGDFMTMDLATIGTFDGVMALDVIEHVLNPEIFLQRTAQIMKPDGRLILHTANAKSLRARLHGGRWNMLIPEYHFFLFTPDSLVRLMVRCGFTEINVTTTSGTGLERGLSACMASAKEKLLNLAGLGNGLLITARKPPAS